MLNLTLQERLLLAQKYCDEADRLREQGEYDAALLILGKANALQLSSGGASDKVRANMYHAMSRIYFDQNDYADALSFNQQALDIRIHIFGETGEDSLESAIFRGNIMVHLGKYRETLDYYQTILDKCTASSSNHSVQYGILYLEIATCHIHLEDYWQAILYFQKAVEIFQTLEDPETEWQAECFHALGVCYTQIGNLQEAIRYYQKALSVFVAAENHVKSSYIHIDLGVMYLQMKEYQKAVDFLQKGLVDLNTMEGNHAYAFSVVYMELGRSYGGLNNFEEGQRCLQKSLDVHLQIYEFPHPKLARIYLRIGILNSEEKAFIPALKALQKGLQACVASFTNEDVYQNPSLQDIQNNECVPLLAMKADVLRRYYLDDEEDAQKLEVALESAELGIRVLEQVRQSYYSDHSKLFTEEVHAKTYKIGLEVAHAALKKTNKQNALEKAFWFAEKAKAALLLSAIQEEVAKVTSPISANLLQQEQTLRTQLNELDKALQSENSSKSTSTKDATIQALQVEFWEQHWQYSQLMKQLEAEYPDYYQLKYQTHSIAIAETQAILQASELLIQYCVYAEKMFVFAIGSDSVFFEAISLDIDLNQLIDNFQKAIFLSDAEQYIEFSNQLYQILFAPIEAEWKGKNKGKLIVIPDGDLHRLTFDALLHPSEALEAEQEFSKLPYLIQTFDVQYHYSATLIGHTHTKLNYSRENIKEGFLGVAPVRFGKRVAKNSGYILKSSGGERQIIHKSGGGDEKEVLLDLEASETEVKAVYKLFEAHEKESIALFYDMASKQNLLEYIEDYSHILLSTHGFADTQHSALSGLNLYAESSEDLASTDVSQNGKLYISDVMNLHLHADLVVLSSCESGVGKLQTGEGMMALHRAFLYAGAQNIVYSLFKVPQDSTSLLVQDLFEHLLAGDAYSTALRKAKLALINNEAMEPADWAGFALIGGVGRI